MNKEEKTKTEQGVEELTEDELAGAAGGKSVLIYDDWELEEKKKKGEEIKYVL